MKGILNVEPMALELLEGALQGDVPRSYFVGAYLEEIQEIWCPSGVGRAVRVDSLELGDQVAHQVLFQGERVSYLLAVSSTDFDNVLAGEESRGV